MTEVQNAGLRLWQVQKAQGTGLCVGLDPHLKPTDEPDFYSRFVGWKDGEKAYEMFRILAFSVGGYGLLPETIKAPYACASFLAGLTAYFLAVVDAAWAAGVRVFKPQGAFYELLAPFGGLVVETLLYRLQQLAQASNETGVLLVYRVYDIKRGDIDSTQTPYYQAYLTDTNQETYPGVNARYGFNTMTVTTWMGLDVLTPGLPLFRSGHGAIVVTRTSNPSGTTLQDALVAPNTSVELSPKQEPFRYTLQQEQEIMDIIGKQPMVHELMLYQTEKFSRDNGLNQDGISPLFSVMGSTVKMVDSFRKLRPGGIGLIPGFGEQSRGKSNPFVNILPLYVPEGPLAGHLGILSSSRAHNYPWMEKYGGKGDPNQLHGEMARMIDQFRNDEETAYIAAGLDYPF